jgi:hypothetical protein
MLPIIEKKGEKLTKPEEKLKDWAIETSRLIEKHGKPAAARRSRVGFARATTRGRERMAVAAQSLAVADAENRIAALIESYAD